MRVRRQTPIGEDDVPAIEERPSGGKRDEHRRVRVFGDTDDCRSPRSGSWHVFLLRPSIAPEAVDCKAWYIGRVTFTIELEREDDGRWLAEVPALPGVMTYGQDRDDAVARVQALALRVIADRLEHREAPAEFLNVNFQAA
jgi:predicted RNase H-like HicB family nuclease